ncbi:MAG TPA: Rdx family protein [Gaiellales bacterium]|nr:Rdx family protein [Gaiellales bacterium]
MAARVIAGWGGVLRVLEIVPGTGGVFDVHVDDELLFTKSMIGHYPEPDEVLPLLRERIGAELPGS